jgi:AraC-like DNA-binding protein
MAYDSSGPDKGKFLDQDRDLVIFAMKNIIMDMVHTNDRDFLGITVNCLNDQLAVLLWHHVEAENKADYETIGLWENSVKAFVEELRKVLTNYLRLPVTAGLGVGTSEIGNLPQAYRQALSALTSRLVVGGEQIIAPEEPYDYLRNFQNMDDLNRGFLQSLIMPIVQFVQNKTIVEHEQMIDKVTAFMHDNYHQDISQDQCARNFGVSRTHLSKLFKKFKHIGFSDYLTQIRVEKAKDLLRETDFPVSDISEKVGYLHPQNFIRVFKKMEGITPGQFREERE